MGQREREEVEVLSDDEEEKARDEKRRKLGTRSDPSLLINLSERDRRRAWERHRERRRERDGAVSRGLHQVV